MKQSFSLPHRARCIEPVICNTPLPCSRCPRLPMSAAASPGHQGEEVEGQGTPGSKGATSLVCRDPCFGCRQSCLHCRRCCRHRFSLPHCSASSLVVTRLHTCHNEAIVFSR